MKCLRALLLSLYVLKGLASSSLFSGFVVSLDRGLNLDVENKNLLDGGWMTLLFVMVKYFSVKEDLLNSFIPEMVAAMMFEVIKVSIEVSNIF